MSPSKRTNPFLNRQPLAGTGREAFLARVRKALGHTATLPPVNSPEIDERVLRQVSQDEGKVSVEERVARWAKLAEGNSVKVLRTKSGELLGALDSVLSQHAVTQAMLNVRELGKRFPMESHLAAKKVVVHQWGEKGCGEAIFHCEMSITDCRAGIADTGAFLVWSDAGFGRSSTLVVPVHVILIGASQILADLIDALAMVRRANAVGLPSNVVVINGPSKTADIEMKMVTGVHGPKYVYAILLEDV